MNRLDVKILFLKKGSSATKIASELRVSSASVYQVMSGRTASRRIAAALERVLELSLAEIQEAYRTQYIPPKHGQRNDSAGSLLIW